MTASAWNYGISSSHSVVVEYPAYKLSFTINGNNYEANLALDTGASSADSTDWDATAAAMVAALTSGLGYSNVHLYKYDVTTTQIV